VEQDLKGEGRGVFQGSIPSFAYRGSKKGGKPLSITADA